MMTKRQQGEKSITNENSNKNEDDEENNLGDYLANERTFLAWTRTGLTIFTLGCAIGKFGGTGNTTTTTNLSSPDAQKKPLIAGIILAIIGILSLVYGIWRFFQIHQGIKRKQAAEKPDIIGPMISVVLLIGALVAVMIIFFVI